MIKFADTRILDKQIREIADYILTSGQFINGPHTRLFSKLWANECGANYCIPTSSGMASLITALKAVAAPSSRKLVIVPDLSFAATAFAVVEAGLTPVYCSVKEDGLLNQETCLNIINNLDILAVIPVYLYGQWFKIHPEILERTAVIEDACQAHGVVKKVQGKVACFSFYPSKNLGAAGDAGAIVTDDEEIKDYCEKYINYGGKQKYCHELVGNNLRMDEIQAAILSEKLKRDYLRQDHLFRAKTFVEYAKAGIDSFVQFEHNSFHLYPILRKNRDAVREELREKGIETGNHYPYTLSEVCPGVTDFLTDDYSKELSRHVLTLPIGRHVLEEDVFNLASNLAADRLYASV